MTPSALHDLAVSCGATVLGDPPHYMFDAPQLLDFVGQVDGTAACAALQERMRKATRPAK